jgi:hypothetical protein
LAASLHTLTARTDRGVTVESLWQWANISPQRAFTFQSLVTALLSK